MYEPTIVDSEQRFVANIVSVQHRLIALGELLPERGKALKFGTPIHTLLIHLDPEGTLFELNGQANTRGSGDVERLELTPTTLRIVFATGRGPFSGRVSLSEQLEIFDRDRHRSRRLTSILVEMRPTKTQLARMRKLLASHLVAKPRGGATRGSVSSARRARTSRRASGSRP